MLKVVVEKMNNTLSTKPLDKKLGIKPGLNILFINQPEGYLKGLIKENYNPSISSTTFDKIPKSGNFDFIQIFAHSRERLEENIFILKPLFKKNGCLWISWPKSHCDIRSNLNENIVREIGLRNGLVDIKIVSLNEDWSGLKFVYRLKDR
ncbi:MAG TPA: DUF3052 domain-containing protein [Patescibacteria group bacterium]